MCVLQVYSKKLVELTIILYKQPNCLKPNDYEKYISNLPYYIFLELLHPYCTQHSTHGHPSCSVPLLTKKATSVPEVMCLSIILFLLAT